MRNTPIAILLALGILLPVSACAKSHYLSLEDRRKTEETSNYRIVRKMLVASADPKMNLLTTWLELQNHSLWRARVTIDCRFYKRTPNEPVANAVRTFVLQPWQVRTEIFNTVSLRTEAALFAWCGLIDFDFIKDTTTHK